MGCVPRGLTVRENTEAGSAGSCRRQRTGPAPLRRPAPTPAGSRGAAPSPPAGSAAPVCPFFPAPSQGDPGTARDFRNHSAPGANTRYSLQQVTAPQPPAPRAAWFSSHGPCRPTGEVCASGRRRSLML